MPQPIDRIRLLEDLGADAWPAATTAWLEGWRLSLDARRDAPRQFGAAERGTAGRRRRCADREVERRYRAHGLSPCFKLTAAAEPADLDHRLERRKLPLGGPFAGAGSRREHDRTAA